MTLIAHILEHGKGLRQGTPLPPLFNLAVDVFTRLLS
jgi:hypothetical protein